MYLLNIILISNFYNWKKLEIWDYKIKKYENLAASVLFSGVA